MMPKFDFTQAIRVKKSQCGHCNLQCPIEVEAKPIRNRLNISYEFVGKDRIMKKSKYGILCK